MKITQISTTGHHCPGVAARPGGGVSVLSIDDGLTGRMAGKMTDGAHDHPQPRLAVALEGLQHLSNVFIRVHNGQGIPCIAQDEAIEGPPMASRPKVNSQW